MAKTFTLNEGYSVKDLLHYGFAHIEAAEILFDKDPNYYDSAGYLAHLGVELILKAWHLQVFGKFEDTHRIKELYDELRKVLNTPNFFDSSNEGTLVMLDEFNKLRYPSPNGPIEIGVEDAEKVRELTQTLWGILPDELIQAYGKISRIRKGGRVLMVRNKKIPKD